MSDAIIEPEVDETPAGPHDIEVRSAPSLEVRISERMIDVIAVPYEQTTEVLYRGRMINETVARGAFDGVQMRQREFSVNRAHDPERPIGWVHRLRPRDERGLVAEIGPVRPTQDGNDALELAAAGLLGASVGFMVRNPVDEKWSIDRRSRTINKAWLDHIALTGAPAYPGAKVLAVRSTLVDDDVEEPVPGGPTPNLDRVLAELMAERYSPPQPST